MNELILSFSSEYTVFYATLKPEIKYDSNFFLLFDLTLFQSAALVAVANVYESLDETSIRKMVLPKIKLVFEKNQCDLKIVTNVLQCIQRTLDKLDKSQVNKKTTKSISNKKYRPARVFECFFVCLLMKGKFLRSIEL